MGDVCWLTDRKQVISTRTVQQSQKPGADSCSCCIICMWNPSWQGGARPAQSARSIAFVWTGNFRICVSLHVLSQQLVTHWSLAPERAYMYQKHNIDTVHFRHRVVWDITDISYPQFWGTCKTVTDHSQCSSLCTLKPAHQFNRYVANSIPKLVLT